MQALEETESSLSDRVELMAVRGEEDKAEGEKRKEEVKEQLRVLWRPWEMMEKARRKKMKRKKEGEKEDEEMNGGVQAQQEEEDWEIPYSDEEMEDPKNWMPPPRGDQAARETERTPRRPNRRRTSARLPHRQSSTLTKNKPWRHPKNAFLSRRRTPGSSARSTVKREARLDKVLSDMKRHRKIEEQILRTGRDLFKSDKPPARLPPQERLSPTSQREREKERERDSDPSTVFSPRQRRY
ncbi:hypothetical protein SRHO_G00162160 [Serrasalmus rhombeus]